MIIGENFVWLHFPKCAGTTVGRLLRELFGSSDKILFDELDPDHVIWHHSLKQRRAIDATFSPDGKEIICGFRRLPAWYLSRVFYEASRSPDLRVDRDMCLRGEFFEANGKRNRADAYIKLYRQGVTRWIRQEHLREDFEKAFSDLLDLSAVSLDEALAGQKGDNRLDYIRHPSFYFTPEELAALYRHNPLWADTEMEVYGSLGAV